MMGDVHYASAEHRNKQEFLPRAKVEFEEFGDRNDDDVDINGDAVPCGYEPEDTLVYAVFDGCFAVPGCPDTYKNPISEHILARVKGESYQRWVDTQMSSVAQKRLGTRY